MTRYYKPSTERELLDPNFKDKVNKRKFYSSNSRNDYIQYISDGAKQDKGYDYVEYMDNAHEKASGLFDKDGLITNDKKKQIRDNLRVTKSVIWDLVISFDKDFAEGKINSFKDAVLVLNKILPKFFEENGLDEENICWFAGLHQNTEHPHIHLSFFERKPINKRANKKGLFFHNGDITRPSIDNFKIRCEEYLSGNKFYIDSYRQIVLDETFNVLSMLQGKNKGEKKIKEKLSELYYKMPKGNVSYNNLEFAPFRGLVDEIGEMIINSNLILKKEYLAFKNDLKRKDEETTKICESQHIDPSRYLVKDKYILDYKKRIGNQIIKYAKKYEFEAKYDDVNKYQNEKMRKLQKRYRQNLLRSTASLTAMVESETTHFLDEYESLIKKAERFRLEVDGGIEAE